MSKENITHKRPGSRIALGVISYVWFFIMLLAILIPFYVLIVTSITSKSEFISSMEFIGFPKNGATIEAYKNALFSGTLTSYGISILRGFFNTMWQSLPPIFSGLFMSGLAGFAYAKLKFPFKNLLFALTLATIMIPHTVLTMPSYIYYDLLGIANTVFPIMLPGLFGGGMMVFFLSQFFETVPTDLIEAAKVDGMSYMQMYVRIMIPLAKPAFIAQFIFAFVGRYNSYMGPLLYLNGQIKLYPLQMVLTLCRSMYSSNTPIICAFLILALVPLLIVYLFMQKYFTEGIASTGLKG